eukprot:8461-Pleurochrysis_carterae.AAC.1
MRRRIAPCARTRTRAPTCVYDAPLEPSRQSLSARSSGTRSVECSVLTQLGACSRDIVFFLVVHQAMHALGVPTTRALSLIASASGARARPPPIC